MWTPKGAALAMEAEYKNESAARKDLRERYKVAVNKLACLEDAEAEGRLIVLPHKVGLVAYMVVKGCGMRECDGCNFVDTCKNYNWHVEAREARELFWGLYRDKLGTDVFITEEEAQAEVNIRTTNELNAHLGEMMATLRAKTRECD